MKVHHGEMLKARVDRSSLSVTEIVKRSGVAKSSLYDMFEKDELLLKKIEPILHVLKVHPDDFFTKRIKTNASADDGGLAADANIQLTQIINLCKKQIELQEEMMALLKRKK